MTLSMKPFLTYKRQISPFVQKLTLKEPFMTIVGFVASEDQDQAAQNIHSDL